MYSVTVRDHVMIAHSFRGATFGPAQRLHGATYVVDLTLYRPELDADGVVVDIGLAAGALRGVLDAYAYRNLDEMPEFAGRNTTTEVMAKTVFDRMAARLSAGALGDAAAGITAMKVTLSESHIASASYEAPLDAVRR